MFTRIFLAIIGAIYWGLAIWCAVSPRQTSESLGFDLRPGGGQSEFLAVYGGLQFGLGALFLWPLLNPEFTPHALLMCLVAHGAIVIFRSLGFALYSGIPTMTIGFAVSEWVVTIAAGWLWWNQTQS